MSLFLAEGGRLAPGGAGLFRSSHEGGPREDEGLFGETAFPVVTTLSSILYIFEGIRSFPFLLIFFLAEAVSSADPVRTALEESSSS